MKRAPRFERLLPLALTALVGAGCTKEGNETATSPAVADAKPSTAPLVPAFADTARAIAAEYQSWGRVDDELRWAPALCRLPLPAVARVSTSEHADTHGRKLYSLFAKNHAVYPKGPHAGQVLVKESWLPEPTNTAYAPQSFRPTGVDHFYPYAKKDGAVYHAKERAGLYLMWKLTTPSPDSDAGWVYATITATGEVSAAGRITDCMDCHQHANNERFFGLPAM
jgi:hypothetical protein